MTHELEQRITALEVTVGECRSDIRTLGESLKEGHKRLREAVDTYGVSTVTLQMEQRNHAARIDDVRETVYGKHAEPGLKGRVQLLEDFMLFIKKLSWVLVVGVLGLIANLVLEVFKIING